MTILFAPSFFNLYERRILCAAVAKSRFFPYDTETTRTTYQVLFSSSTYCCRFTSSTAGTLIALLYEKGDAVRIEPPPPSLSTCRLSARSSRTLFRPQASGDGTRMPSVLGESRASCRLSSRTGSNSGSQQQQYEELVNS